MITEYIKDSEAFGIKGLCRAESLERFFEDFEIREAMINGEIWSPRPGFYKVTELDPKGEDEEVK